MCGIIAVVDRTRAAVRPTIERMTGTLGHRVPDDTGVWQSPDGTVALGHCRLAVIDLSALGRNPMTLRQGRYWMTDPPPDPSTLGDLPERQTHRTDLLWQIYALVAWSRRFRAEGVRALTS